MKTIDTKLLKNVTGGDGMSFQESWRLSGFGEFPAAKRPPDYKPPGYSWHDTPE